MKVIREKTESSQAFLTIEMEPAEVEQSLEEAYHRLVKKAKIPGFRSGKAPRAILERHIGRDGLLEDALNYLVPQAYEQAIKEQEIEAIARPQIEIAQTAPLILKAVVPLKPEVKLGDYRHIQVTPQPAEAVTEGDIDAVIEELRHEHAIWEPVERAVDFGDLVVLDIWSNIEGRPYFNRKGVQYQIRRELSFPAPGFAEQLVGMKRDEEKEFKLPFPAHDPGGELAGKEISFRVRTGEIKQEILPELNDEFAQAVKADFKTLASLREWVLSSLKARAEEKARLDFQERVIEAAVGLAQVEFPPVLVEAETDHILNHRFPGGRQELENYLKNAGKTEPELREELRPVAAKRVTRSLALDKVAQEEKVEVSDSEIYTEIENMTKSVARNRDDLEKMLNTPQGRESIKETLITRKTIQRLVEIAKGSERREEEK